MTKLSLTDQYQVGEDPTLGWRESGGFSQNSPKKVFHVVGSESAEAPSPTDEPPPEYPYDDDPEPNRRSRRPVIDAGNEDLEFISGKSWDALQRSNDPPRLFRFGGLPVRISSSDDDALPAAQTLTKDRLSHELARSATFFKITSKDGKKLASPPPRVIEDMLAAPAYPLPSLLNIVQVPVFAPDGSLQTEPGYHEAARSFYAPATGFTVPPVPVNPSKAEVEQARALIVEELFGDFPFISSSELANTVSVFLDPYIRNLIKGPTPLRLIEAPMAGSGKGLLADVMVRAAVGQHINIMPAANDDDEWRKRITAQLIRLPSVISIDNLTSSLDSGSLASVLTTTIWNDRLLGSSEMVNIPNRCVWIATANNPTMSTEIARRTVRIRLDPKVERPWRRTGFRHENLRGWVDDHRSEIVCAALTLVQAWIHAGRPMGSIRLGSFEKWAAVHGGILQTIGVPGFLGNLEEFYEASDLEGATWRQFVALWSDEFDEAEVGVADLFSLALKIEGFDFGKGADRSQRITFGRQLSRQRDRVIGVHRITQTREVRRLKRWRLIRSQPNGDSVDAIHEDLAGQDHFQEDDQCPF
jgi:putative DNA primase/helicase